jgi:hypothetical protein
LLLVNVTHHCKQSVFPDDKNDPKWIDMYACVKKNIFKNIVAHRIIK